MNRAVFLAFASIFVTSSAFAVPPPPPPEVLDLSPAAGVRDTVVTIRGLNLLSSDGTAATVTFGDAVATPLTASREEIRVAAPSFYTHQNGATVVDVIVRTQFGAALIKNAFTYAVGSEDRYERVLLPMVTESPRVGSGGSIWKTELAILNGATRPLAFVVRPCSWANGGGCNQESDVRVESLAARGLLRSLPSVEEAGQPFDPPYDVPIEGRFVYLDRETAGDVAFSLRLRELSREHGSGVDIPVIREREMFRSRLALLGVPLDPGSRAHLRIYADSFAGFTIRITDSDTDADADAENEIPHSVDIPIHAVRTRWGVHFQQQPGYAEIANLREHVRQLFSRDPSSVMIEVLDDGKGIGRSSFWAFVSVTDNTTQEVMLVTPH